MIEKVVYDYLSSSNLSAPVYMEIPKNPPSKFFAIEKTGGSLLNHVSSSTFTVLSYADSLYNAAAMNEEVKEIMLYGLIEDPDVVKVGLNSDYNFTDLQSKRYRYQAVFDIVHY